VKVPYNDVGAYFSTVLGTVRRGKPASRNVAVFQAQAPAMVESDARGRDEHEIQGSRQPEVQMQAADSAERASASIHAVAALILKMNFIFKLIW
jgi:hypothetical protein